MPPFSYQVVVQWDRKNRRYLAYSPTLSTFADRFLPDFPRTAYGDSMSSAVEGLMAQFENLSRASRKLNILLPPADIGSTDPVEYQHTVEEEQGEMLL